MTNVKVNFSDAAAPAAQRQQTQSSTLISHLSTVTAPLPIRSGDWLDEDDDFADGLEEESKRFVHCEPPPLYAPPQSPTARGTRAQIDEKKLAFAGRNDGSSVNTAGPSTSTLASSFSSMLGIRSSQQIALEEHAGKLNTEVLSLEKSGQIQDAQLLEEGLEATCRRYNINRWHVTPRVAAQEWLQHKGMKARSALLRSEDLRAAEFIVQIKDIIDGQKSRYSFTSIFERLTSAIESKETVVRASLYNRLSLTSGALSSASPSEFFDAATKVLAVDLEKNIRQKKNEDAAVVKSLFYSLFSAPSIKQCAPWRTPHLSFNAQVQSLSYLFNMKDWRKERVWRCDLYGLSANNIKKKEWLSFALALGLRPSSFYMVTQGKTYDDNEKFFLAHSEGGDLENMQRDRKAEPANLLYLAFLSESDEALQIEGLGWSGKKVPSVKDVEHLQVTIEDKRTQKKAMEFLLHYSRRSLHGPARLTGLLLDPAFANVLPEDIKEWLLSPIAPL